MISSNQAYQKKNLIAKQRMLMTQSIHEESAHIFLILKKEDLTNKYHDCQPKAKLIKEKEKIDTNIVTFESENKFFLTNFLPKIRRDQLDIELI